MLEMFIGLIEFRVLSGKIEFRTANATAEELELYRMQSTSGAKKYVRSKNGVKV